MTTTTSEQLLTKTEAEALTVDIQKNIESSSKLLRKAHAGKIWLALGFTSFEAWLTDCVGVSRARGYQLLNIARLEEDLHAVCPLPDTFTVSDLNCRLVGNAGRDEFISTVKERKTRNAKVNATIVADLLNEMREQHQPTAVVPEPVAPVDDRADAVFRTLLTTVKDLPTVDDFSFTEDDLNRDVGDFPELSILEATINSLTATLNVLDLALDEYRPWMKEASADD